MAPTTNHFYSYVDARNLLCDNYEMQVIDLQIKVIAPENQLICNPQYVKVIKDGNMAQNVVDANDIITEAEGEI